MVNGNTRKPCKEDHGLPTMKAGMEPGRGLMPITYDGHHDHRIAQAVPTGTHDTCSAVVDRGVSEPGVCGNTPYGTR